MFIQKLLVVQILLRFKVDIQIRTNYISIFKNQQNLGLKVQLNPRLLILSFRGLNNFFFLHFCEVLLKIFAAVKGGERSRQWEAYPSIIHGLKITKILRKVE